VLGAAYKGWPAADDMRGTPIAATMPVLTAVELTVFGHDPLV
jgi:UDP-N-acetyl-D-mannosaminuronic acid dehydrogenase